MHARRSRLPQAALFSAVVLVAMVLGDDLAAAPEGWDTARAVQGLIVLAGFTVALAVGLGLLARTASRLWTRPRMSIAELKRRLDADEDVLVLDVRAAEDFVGEQGHIAGATNVPLEVLESRLGELTGGRERPIALVCRTDRRSDRAAALLARHGFTRVEVVEGGMTAWLANRWPIESVDAQGGSDTR